MATHLLNDPTIKNNEPYAVANFLERQSHTVSE